MFGKKKTPEKEPPPGRQEAERRRQAAAGFAAPTPPWPACQAKERFDGDGFGEHNMAEAALALTSEADAQAGRHHLGQVQAAARRLWPTLFLRTSRRASSSSWCTTAAARWSCGAWNPRADRERRRGPLCRVGNVEVIEDAYDDKRWAGRTLTGRPTTRRSSCCAARSRGRRRKARRDADRQHQARRHLQEGHRGRAGDGGVAAAPRTLSNLSKAQEKEKQLNALLSARTRSCSPSTRKGCWSRATRPPRARFVKGFMGKHFSNGWASERRARGGPEGGVREEEDGLRRTTRSRRASRTRTSTTRRSRSTTSRATSRACC